MSRTLPTPSLLPRLAAAFLAAFTNVLAQETPPTTPEPDPLVAAYGIDPVAAALFAKVEPEFLRYQRVAFYGNTLASTQPTAELVDAEVALYRERRAAGTFAKPNRTDALLCFNLLLHRPEVGREGLAELAKVFEPKVDGFVDSALVTAAMAGGSWGERFAVEGLSSNVVAQRRLWATFIAREATEAETAAAVRARLATETDVEVRAALRMAQGTLLDTGALADLKAAFASETELAVRASIGFAVAEIQGRAALPWLQGLELPAGELRDRIQNSIEYLQTGTTETNPHGFDIGNDAEFVQRFGDLDHPAIVWLRAQGRLDDEALAAAKPFDAKGKAALFDALEASLGFGLEAVKGALFASLEPADQPRLRHLRALCAYSPNQLGSARRRTLLIMIRSLRV